MEPSSCDIPVILTNVSNYNLYYKIYQPSDCLLSLGNELTSSQYHENQSIPIQCNWPRSHFANIINSPLLC